MQRQAPKVKPRALSAPRRKVSNSAKQPSGSVRSTSGGDMVATSRQRHASDVPSVVSLKRCRLSVSPATGLVGMRENAFLSDYFDCLGFLPLASASMVRHAVVKIMLGSLPQQRPERFRVGRNSFDEGQEGALLQEMEGTGGRQALACRDKAGDPSTCILWCTVALGALVQGCPLEFVTGYLQRARDSLAEFFDETTVETARAFLVMSVLHGFLGEEAEKAKYIAFANSIVARMPPEVLPTGMSNMLLTVGDPYKLFLYGGSGAGVPGKPEAASEDVDHIPVVKEIVHATDLCNLVILTNRRLNKALHTDLSGEATGTNTRQTEEGVNRHVGGMERSPIRSGEQHEPGGLEQGQGTEERGPGAPLTSPRVVDGDATGFHDIPRAGEATSTFIDNALPDLGRVSRAIERSDACSGVGGLIYHGDLAYMHLIKGDMDSAIHSINVCARVVIRFPGICRYRQHLVHSILAGAASGMYRSMYDPVRDAYNSTLPGNGTPAPPLDEWRGMSCICNYVFCSSLQMELNHTGFGPNSLVTVDQGHVADSAPHPSSSHVLPSPITEEAHRDLICPAGGAQLGATSMASAATVAVLPYFSNEVAPPPQISALISSSRRVNFTAGGGVELDAAAATEITPLMSSGNQWFCGSTGIDSGSGSTGAGDALPASAPGVRGEYVDAGLSGDSHSSNQEEGRPHATSIPLVAIDDPVSRVVDGSGRYEGGVGVCGVTDSAHDVAGVDGTMGCDSGFLGGEWEGAGLRLSDEDLMQAAEVLMNPDLLDDEFTEEADPCL